MNDLSALKRAAIDAEAAWQEARARELKRLPLGSALFDCGYCARVLLVPGDRMLVYCPCSPRVGQKAIRRAA